ncbi:MAG: hypothetical protein Q9166_006243 [cf. Caloplaca sp. 2 TL-2023]
MTRNPFHTLHILLTWSLIIFIIASGLFVHPTRAVGREPDCWDPKGPFQPLIFRDCLDIINNEITRGEDPDVPLKFSRFTSQHPDIQLPARWFHRTGITNNKCVVGLDVGTDDVAYDRTTLNDIKRTALSIARECVIREPHLGGVVRLGWHNMLGVMVFAYRGPPRNEANGTLETE